ncbi:MAG: ArsR/SmtB family transcription factor [Verrucomicrobiales bacterium]
MKLDLSDPDRVATFFRAFAEPTRLVLLQELKNGERTVSSLVDALSPNPRRTPKKAPARKRGLLESRSRTRRLGSTV